MSMSIDVDRLEKLADWPQVSIAPYKGVTMEGLRWSVRLVGEKSPICHTDSFPKALRVAEDMREAFVHEAHRWALWCEQHRF